MELSCTCPALTASLNISAAVTESKRLALTAYGDPSTELDTFPSSRSSNTLPFSEGRREAQVRRDWGKSGPKSCWPSRAAEAPAMLGRDKYGVVRLMVINSE
jgi:hypothetical protein